MFSRKQNMHTIKKKTIKHFLFLLSRCTKDMIKSARFTLRAFSIVPLDITSKNGVFFVRLPIADYSFTRYTYKG